MIEKKVGDKTYGFLFNFYAFGIVEELLNLPLDDVLSLISDKKKPKLKLIITILYAGAVNYKESKGEDVTFKVNDVGDWVEDIGLTDSMLILREALKVFTPKNSSPLPAEGEKNIGE